MNILTGEQINQFLKKGYVQLSKVVPDNICEQVRSILWKDLDADPNDRSTWTKAVIRLWDYNQEPFRIAANMPDLHRAFNDLLGNGNWLPRGSLGTFPVRFPADEEPGDTGWHVDSGFPGDDPSEMFSWRINIHSKGRGLLMLFLFSDVGPLDAPTRILAGSHTHIAKILAPFGDEGLSFLDLAKRLPELPQLPEELALGEAGTVYLCHPFIVHAAQKNRGTSPKFMAQPPLMLKSPFMLKNKPEDCYPVERAIIEALSN